jgi:hypothetical protein
MERFEMSKPIPCVLLITVSVSGLMAQDALNETLAEVGMQRQDLGWRVKGWWPRFPTAEYKLRAFDSLFEEPLATVAWGRSLADVARVQLDPESEDSRAERTGGRLHQAVHGLGINPRFGGLRGYTTNLTAGPTDIVDAILAIHHAAGRPTEFITFGTESPYPKYRDDLSERAADIPNPIRPIIGQLILNIIDAQKWASLTFRRVNPDDLRVAARRLNMGEEGVDALDYCPQIDDVAREWDEASLWYAGEKCVDALDIARIAIVKSLKNTPVSESFSFDWETPWGWIRIRGAGNDNIDGHDSLLIIDLAGDDTYTGPVAATDEYRLISLALDLNGNDKYNATVPAQGAGICGIGILIDATGDDSYYADRYAQGVGQFGLGVCADLAGDDSYDNKYSGQGCGYFGIGLLLDCTGRDSYKLYAEGQGFAGASGVGVLADRQGDDTYEAVRDSTITKRDSYHSPDQHISVSNAQGVAMGRRGDGADGHSWAGGIGALIDSEGNDSYTAGNWSMGTGYWFGIGLIHDASGDDTYHGCAWSQGTGAHFCIGAAIDEGGNDQHLVEENGMNSLAFGHDFAVAILIDIGGNDIYRTAGAGIAYSINRSVAALIDIGGDDQYQGREGDHPGMAIFDDRFRTRDGVTTYFADTTSIGLFLDVQGTDTYWSKNENNTVWKDDSEDDNFKERNFSIAIDRKDGEINFLPTPDKTPSRK